jgi:hypothetical protein
MSGAGYRSSQLRLLAEPWEAEVLEGRLGASPGSF